MPDTPSPLTAGVHVAAEVRALIGATKAEEIQARTGTFTCVACGERGHAQHEAVSAVLEASPLYANLRLAHQQCSPSCVLQVPTEAATVPGETDLVPRAIGVPAMNGFRPMLLLAMEEDVFLPAEGTNPWIDHLVRAGLHRLPSLGRSAPSSPGWSIRLSPHGELDVLSPAESVLESAHVTAPPVWRELAQASGSVTLLIGRLDHDDIYADVPPFRAYATALARAEMVAGTVTSRLD